VRSYRTLSPLPACKHA